MYCPPPALDTQCVEVSSFERQDATFDSRGIERFDTDLDTLNNVFTLRKSSTRGQTGDITS